MSQEKKDKKTFTLDELLSEEYKKYDTFSEKIYNFLKYDTGFWRVKRFLTNLYYNLRPFKLKDLCRLFKFWWNNDNYTSHPALLLLQWQLTGVLKVSEKNMMYENQEKYNEELKEFLECLRIEIEEDFGEISSENFDNYIKTANNNLDKLTELFKNHNKWGI